MSGMSHSIRDDVFAYAREIGLDLVGVTTPDPFDRFLRELDARQEHYQGRYAYRLETWRKFADPRAVLPEARSVLVMGFNYLAEEREPAEPSGKLGRIVSYGHLGILKRARLMRSFLEKRGFKAIMGAHRKEAAVRAGLGSIGKHNLVINPTFGSWVAYQSIVTDAPLEPDKPAPDDICGKCDTCLRACPTKALYEPHRVDPRRCVTCLLTSHDVAPEHWPAMGTYILGCDACQDACPRNQGLAPKANLECLLPDGMGARPPLARLLELDESHFQKELIGHIQKKIAGRGLMNLLLRNPLIRTAATAFTKTFLKGREVLPETFVHASGNLEVYQRNALVAAGNLGNRDLIPLVQAKLADPYFKPYAEWALARLKP